jgi:hypothetical protein
MHKVETLYGLSSGTLHQIVDSADNYQPVGRHIPLKPDIAIVGACQEFGFWITMDAAAFFNDPYKRFL